MNVDFFSFNYAPVELRAEWQKKIQDVVQQGIFIGGQEVQKFEKAWSDFTDSKFAVGVSNGMDGLILALRALGIGVGDYVAVPAHTFIATWTAVISVGASPLGIDVDDEGLIDLDKFELIASKVKAVIPVHMHGSTVDMRALYKICLDQNLFAPIKIIEDASQAHGALSRDGSNIGRYSDVAVYSLYPTKNLGALGDAGVITTNNEIIREKLRSLSNYGSSKESKYDHEIMGYNNRLDPIQAAVLTKNLEMLPMWNNARKKLSNFYISELSGIVDILQSSRLDSVRHHLCILIRDRDGLKKHLLSKGIKTEIHYPNVAGVEALRFMDRSARFPKSEEITSKTLSLPLSQWHNTEQVSYVISQIKIWIQG